MKRALILLMRPRFWAPNVALLVTIALTVAAIFRSSLPWAEVTAREFQILVLALLGSLGVHLLSESLLHEADRSGESLVTTALRDHDELYGSAVRAILHDPGPGLRRIWATSIFPGETPETVSDATRRYDKALATRLRQTTPEWDVRMILLIDSEHRLDNVLSQLGSRNDAVHHQLRAYVGPAGVSALSPLIVGREVFVSVQDRKLGRGEFGLRIVGDEALAMFSENFVRLWDEAPFRLRTLKGIDQDVVKSLRSEIRRIEKLT